MGEWGREGGVDVGVVPPLVSHGGMGIDLRVWRKVKAWRKHRRGVLLWV